MGYSDKSIVPIRHLGKLKSFHTGVDSYLETAAAITGTFLTTPTEGEVITGTQTIILTLGQGKWVASGTKFNGQRQNIIDGLDSAQSEATGWNTKVRDIMAVTTVVRTSATIVTITLPATDDYNISANETITFTLPRTAVEGWPASKANETTITIVNSTPEITAALTGTLGETPTEHDIIIGGKTLIITLTGGTWVPSGTAFNAVRQSIIDGMVSAGAEAAGWDVQVIGALAVGDVVRTSNTIVTITLPAVPAYEITANEIVTIAIPRLAIAEADAAVVVTETVDISEAPAITAALTGTFLTTPTETEVITGTQTIICTLTGGTWAVAAGSAFDNQRQNIIDGLTSAGAEATGWNTKVRDVMAVTTVVRTSNTIVTITLPATPDYNISANETVTMTIPLTAIAEADAAVVATETIEIANDAPAVTAALTGTFLTTPTATEVIAGGQTIIATLTGGVWATGTAFDAQRQAIINGLDSDGAAAAGWDAVVKTALAVTDVVRTADTICTITLPAVATYKTSASETVTMTIPRLAIQTVDAAVVATETIAIVTPSAALTGTFLTTPTEGEVVTGGQTIIITLTGGSWVADGAAFNAIRQSIIDGMTSGGAEAAGWNAVVKASLAPIDVVRTSASVATVTLPACATYAIDANETVTVTVPAATIDAAAAAVVATPTIEIAAA